MWKGEHVTELLGRDSETTHQEKKITEFFCTGHFGAKLLSYLFLLLQVVQGHSGKDGLDFNLEPAGGTGEAF